MMSRASAALAAAPAWEMQPFDRVLRKVNAKENQILASEYQDSGLLPVVDQGKSLIAGYSDRVEKRFSCPSGGVIVFGDHTRITKFIDFDFVVGADGTQILCARDGYDSRFLAYQLQNASIPNAGYSRHFKFLKGLAFPCPPLEEQKAIATALSDVDELIGSLDRLMAKKRDIKQGAAQALLSGQTRLRGFSGEWRTKRLGEVLVLRHGKSQHQVEERDGRYPILATGGEIGRTGTWLYDKPSVLIGRKGTIDKPQYVDVPFWTIDTLFYSEIDLAVASPKFIYYLFGTIDWYAYNEASGVPSLNASTIEAIEIFCPSLPEQEEVAGVLSAMDAEISALEKRRDKTKALKQGMMQELLTGRIRLV